ncbi:MULTISPECIES: triose-phosphate isomerase [Paraclostridium]|uniref:Triosephosphate isomerase n=2 Tax=Paraclostridium TaxID=1849822 RepID=A0A0M3DJ22_9FIRM|nr:MULTISPECIES: triose-phosphate isomerase [Paraclostridium]KGJ49064.1 triosephosphate isomerase [Clostridium sp. NCR]MCU9806767.1 triose-phosphate isomerase [Paraclostridium sp. AKS46]MDV8111841.1 triose-phosphate isomerase [Bacillus sp. BAU-SS-2023]RDC50597.1 triose-phosphate isomerase [Acinetobacter sp. RIT592]EQK44937.1 triose-phosphate isomerase [[Clostridium] bifermentans ATCC 19299] [Paraclostridium bifermentans ATCC 19299]
MRKPIIAGNWKMHKTIAEAVEFVNEIKGKVNNTDVEAVICAPFTLLKDLKEATKGTPIKIGAQNMHYADNGAFTGEISAPMLKELDIDYVVLGHSERRQYFNETNETVNKKVLKALEAGIDPILCIGETLEEREADKTKDVCKVQTEKALENVTAEDMKKVVIAYEPIWAIGTGKTATAEQANDVIAYVREVVKGLYGEEISEEVRIQYGGSVKPSNVSEIMNQTDIDGALVGGASLQPADFTELVNF